MQPGLLVSSAQWVLGQQQALQQHLTLACTCAGITRHMRVGEAKKKCPELQLVHVQTIGGMGAAVFGA